MKIINTKPSRSAVWGFCMDLEAFQQCFLAEKYFVKMVFEHTHFFTFMLQMS